MTIGTGTVLLLIILATLPKSQRKTDDAKT